MHSSIPAFKKALVERLTADTTIAADSVTNSNDVTVSHSNPHPQQMSRATIIIDDVKDAHRERVAALTQANETYKVSCLLSVTGDVRNDREALWQRAYDLFDAIDASILAWRTTDYHNGAGVSVCSFAQVGDFHDQDATDSANREAAIVFDVDVLARIS